MYLMLNIISHHILCVALVYSLYLWQDILGGVSAMPSPYFDSMETLLLLYFLDRLKFELAGFVQLAEGLAHIERVPDSLLTLPCL